MHPAQRAGRLGDVTQHIVGERNAVAQLVDLGDGPEEKVVDGRDDATPLTCQPYEGGTRALPTFLRRPWIMCSQRLLEPVIDFAQ